MARTAPFIIGDRSFLSFVLIQLTLTGTGTVLGGFFCHSASIPRESSVAPPKTVSFTSLVIQIYPVWMRLGQDYSRINNVLVICQGA